jgi:hypothetical protein
MPHPGLDSLEPEAQFEEIACLKMLVNPVWRTTALHESLYVNPGSDYTYLHLHQTCKSAKP